MRHIKTTTNSPPPPHKTRSPSTTITFYIEGCGLTEFSVWGGGGRVQSDVPTANVPTKSKTEILFVCVLRKQPRPLSCIIYQNGIKIYHRETYAPPPPPGQAMLVKLCSSQEKYYILKKSLYSLYFHSLGSDVSDHFFWSEYRVNRTRFHSLSSEFSLYWSWNRVKFTPQRVKSLHCIDGVNYSLDLCLESTNFNSYNHKPLCNTKNHSYCQLGVCTCT